MLPCEAGRPALAWSWRSRALGAAGQAGRGCSSAPAHPRAPAPRAQSGTGRPRSARGGGPPGWRAPASAGRAVHVGGRSVAGGQQATEQVAGATADPLLLTATAAKAAPFAPHTARPRPAGAAACRAFERKAETSVLVLPATSMAACIACSSVTRYAPTTCWVCTGEGERGTRRSAASRCCQAAGHARSRRLLCCCLPAATRRTEPRHATPRRRPPSRPHQQGPLARSLAGSPAAPRPATAGKRR